MKKCLIIPTLNEEGNITELFKKIRKTKIKIDLLFIDDNSSDNTQNLIVSLKKKYRFINYLFRKNKTGIGLAHKDGIEYCYKKKYDIAITMDADGTHDPVHLNEMINLINLKKYQIISTNRFLKKKSLNDWPFWRKIITHLRHLLIVVFLGIKFDSSGAFRAYDLRCVAKKDVFKAKSNSYSFFWESMYFLSKKYCIYEIPINLPGRFAGQSKMKFSHIYKALTYLLIFFLKNRIFLLSK